MPQEIIDKLIKQKINFKEENNLENALKITDVIYVTRIQKERFNSQQGGLICCDFSPDEKYVAIGGQDDIIYIYNIFCFIFSIWFILDCNWS